MIAKGLDRLQEAVHGPVLEPVIHLVLFLLVHRGQPKHTSTLLEAKPTSVSDINLRKVSRIKVACNVAKSCAKVIHDAEGRSDNDQHWRK